LKWFSYETGLFLPDENDEPEDDPTSTVVIGQPSGNFPGLIPLHPIDGLNPLPIDGLNPLPIDEDRILSIGIINTGNPLSLNLGP